MRKLVIAIIAIFLTVNLFCQIQTDISEYKHLTGNLGSFELICDLLITGNEINGNAYSPGRVDSNLNQEDNTFGYRLQGTIDEYGIADLEAYEANKAIGTFSGRLESQYKGTFRPEGSAMALSFLLDEDYTRGIAFEGYNIKRDSALLDSAGSPEAKIDISLLLPSEADTFSYIRQAVLNASFGKNELAKHPDDSILLIYSDIYFRKYIESNIDIFDGGYSFNWEMLGTAYINLNRAGLLVYRTENYGYSGGAHGMGVSRFLVFDTRQKAQLSLEDIFIDSYERDLAALLEKKYREQMFMDEDESLVNGGLFGEDIHPSQNFWLTDESIGFFYNPYELAPYSMGSISISLQKDEIFHILKEGTPVKRLGW